MRFLQTSLLLLAGALHVLGGYDPSKNTNLAAYWGQNSAGKQNNDITTQDRLSTYCKSQEIDIFIIAFVLNPITHELNLANQQGKCTPGSDGSVKCPQVQEDIKECQKAGKTILLSIGGEGASFSFADQKAAEDSAQSMFDLFGKSDTSNPKRPFGDAAVDGFDIDVEVKVGLIKEFAAKLRALVGDKGLLTAAPQCLRETDSMLPITDGVDLDIVFVQFYNIQSCSADNPTSFGYADWEKWASGKAKKPKVFVGLPAAKTAANSGGYVDPDKLGIIDATSKNASFGGVMLWDASQAWHNGNYHVEVKKHLTGK